MIYAMIHSLSWKPTATNPKPRQLDKVCQEESRFQLMA